MKNIAVVVAAGKGKRFKSKIPKQYIKVDGKEILFYTLEKFEKERIIDGILLVVEQKFINSVKKKIKKYNLKKIIDVINGGKERYESVLNAINFLKNVKPENILIHDGVRPYFDKNLIRKIVFELKRYSAVIPVKTIDFTVKEIAANFVKKTIDRRFLRTAHTPQGFKYNKILKIYTKENILKYRPTDEAMLFEKKGFKVKIVEDEKINLKITTKNDLYFFKNIIKKGYDKR